MNLVAGLKLRVGLKVGLKLRVGLKFIFLGM